MVETKLEEEPTNYLFSRYNSHQAKLLSPEPFDAILHHNGDVDKASGVDANRLCKMTCCGRPNIDLV
jgi:hypothetical protein